MSRNYNDLLKVAYEIEGLLSLQSQRCDNHVEAVDRLLAEKIAILAETFQSENEPEVKNRAENENEPEVITDAEIDEAKESATSEDTATQTATAPPVVNETIETPQSLEEKLARERARDIFQAFTLNDKFRFRRELFRNSQEEFDETLNIIAQMSTIEEASEYIYDDLCWNPDNEDVKAFMDVVTKHF